MKASRDPRRPRATRQPIVRCAALLTLTFAATSTLGACRTRTYNTASGAKGTDSGLQSDTRTWVPGANVTDAFRARLDAVSKSSSNAVSNAVSKSASTPASGGLNGVKLLLVPGLSGNEIRAVAGLTIRATAAGREKNHDYFDDQLSACKAFGWECEFVTLDTKRLVPTNAATLAARFRAETSPYIVLGHSRGGVDTLAALLLMSPEDRRLLRGWVSLQSPHAGIPAAARIDNLAGPLRPFLFQFGKVNAELTPDVSRARVDERREALEALGREVPLLTLGSWFDASATDTPEKGRSLLGPLEKVTRGLLASTPEGAGGARSGRNDGVVALEDSRLPGVRYIDLPAHDHVSTVFKYEGAPALDYNAFLAALMETLQSVDAPLEPAKEPIVVPEEASGDGEAASEKSP